MRSPFDRVARKLLWLRNKVFVPSAGEISRLCEMMQTSPRGREDAQDWAMEFANLLETSLFNRLSKRDLALIFAGLVSYRNTGVTPQVSHVSLMRAYESSSGLMQDMLHKVLFPDPAESAGVIASEFFGEVPVAETGAILRELDEQGYVVMPTGMSDGWIDALVSEARKLGYVLRNAAADELDTDSRKIDPSVPPKCVAAYAKSSELAGSRLFTKLSNDPLLIYLASKHVGAKVQPIDSTLWYSFASDEPSADAAQLFHYDLDTLKWLKIFVYLTDVGPDGGPHEYVPASHKPGAKPHQLMDRDYARLADQDIDEYCEQARKVICGEKGTVILGDTRCFHKGRAVNVGYRLIFSPIYAASRIGYFHGV